MPKLWMRATINLKICCARCPRVVTNRRSVWPNGSINTCRTACAFCAALLCDVKARSQLCGANTKFALGLRQRAMCKTYSNWRSARCTHTRADRGASAYFGASSGPIAGSASAGVVRAQRFSLVAAQSHPFGCANHAFALRTVARRALVS